MKTENNAQERMLEMQIDAALTSYPVAPLPQSFTSQVMAQIEFTQQEPVQVAPIATRPEPLRRYLRLYEFELACSLLLTLGLVIGIAWPLFAQARLLPMLWSDTPAMGTHLETLFTHYLSSWYAIGIGVVILLELGIALLAWVAWMEQPRLKVQ